MRSVGTEEGNQLRAGEDRRQALVAAAFHCLAEKGFEGLRLRDVAAVVGIDHSTLHHYFSTKEDLIASVVDYATRQFWTTLPAEGTPAAQIRHHLAILGRMIEERPALFIVLRELDLRATRDATVRAIIERHEEGWRTALADVLRRGAKEMAWTEELDVDTGVALIIAVVRGASLHPAQAGAALQQLARLLTAQRLNDRI